MDKIKLEIFKCIQDSQEYGSNNEHMISRIFFKIGEKNYECNIRQPYGENYSFEKEPIEVETPKELTNIVNYGDFREALESYYRELIGKNSLLINISNSANVRMQNNTFNHTKIFFINSINSSQKGW